VSSEGKVSAFFRSEGEVLFWPGGGLLLDDRLLVFLMRIRNSQKELGFSILGWGAVLFDNPLDDPTKWQIEFIATPQNMQNILVGSGSSLRKGDWVYSFKELMMYAAKVHPEQETQGLAVTYCTNTRHLAKVIENESLYYPRFVRFVF
jgi:hypothetical protein